MVLSMTHEEATVFSVLNEATSYLKYPFAVYQIQTKFRDEARPRAGLIRVREFTMKDAYSFHTTNESLNEEYDKYYNAYMNIFKRVGIPEVIAVSSDTGMMGGNGAHEFMLLCDSGEDKIITCNECNYSANMEVAYTDKYDIATLESTALKKIHTPNIKTIDELTNYLDVPSIYMGKAVIYKRLDTNETIIVFIRADREVNETKLRNLFGIDDEALVPKKEEDTDNIVYGFVGPINLNVNATIVYDKSLENEKSLIFGANEKDYHYMGVDISRDIDNVKYVDVAKVEKDDYCPICKKKSLNISNGIEVGNIFKLGTKYTELMNMTYIDEEGKKKNPIMGCYGIGVGRLFASVLEKRATEKKANIPPSIAPFDIHICPLDYTKNEQVKSKADKLYSILSEKYDVLLDDRNKNAGVKFADSDLISAPIRIVISKKTLEEDSVEIKTIESEESKIVNENEILKYIENVRKGWIF